MDNFSCASDTKAIKELMCRFAMILMDVYTSKLFLDQRRMEEIIANLTKMRFGDQEQTKLKDTKEVQNIFTPFR